MYVSFFFVFCFHYNKYSHTIQHPSDLAGRKKKKKKNVDTDMLSRSGRGGLGEEKGKKKKEEERIGWRGSMDEGERKEEEERSLFEGLVDRGVGVQAGGAGVHELGGVVRGHRGHAACVPGVGDAGHDCHHLGYLLLQIFDLLVFLQDLTWSNKRTRCKERRCITYEV